MSDRDRGSCWSVTINNPTEVDEECISLARQKGWKVEGQKEVGTEGTPHFQLMVRTPQVRFSAVKKAFPRAHIESARNAQALAQYVTKEDTRTGSLPVAQDRYPSLSRYWEMIVEELDVQRALDWNFIMNPIDERPSSVWWKEAPRQWVRDPLCALDVATAVLIERGYFVEGIACNPSTRMAWKKFHASIIVRTCTQTDRQTDTCVQNPETESGVVNIPTIDADDNSRS